MEFTLTIKGDAQELAALLSQVPATEAPKPMSWPELQKSEAAEPDEEPVAATPPPPSNGQVKATRTRTPKPAPVVATIPEDEAPVQPDPAPEPPLQHKGGTVVSHVAVTLDHLRKLMQTKLAHQAQIVAWLGEFGAKNLSTLDAAHYEDMYSKLNTLK